MGEIHITPKGEEWVQKMLKDRGIDPKFLDELGIEIAKALAEYRKAPVGAIFNAVREEAFGPAKAVAEQLIEELGIDQKPL